MSEEQRIQQETEAAFDLLMRRYGDRFPSEIADELRGCVETVVKTVAALRSARLENGEAPLVGFVPVRKDG